MNSTFSLLLVFLARFFIPRHNAQMRLLKAQIHILRTRIPTQRIILSPTEKSQLLRIAAECGHDVDGFMEVARPANGGYLHPHDARINRIIAMVRAKVEQSPCVIKRQFGYVKTRYRGLARNRSQLFTLFGFGNPFLVRRKLMA